MTGNEQEAIHAGSDAIFASYHKMRERPEVKQVISKRERLARLANSHNWKAVKEVIDEYIQVLKELRSITPSDTVEAVGFRFLASQIAIEYLEDIRDLPERARKVMENAERAEE